MIVPGVVIAFALGLLLEATLLFLLDHRAILREEKFWNDLRAQALDGYGRVFDWAEDDA